MSYTFREETDKKAFEDFVLTHNGLFLQSAKWAEVKTAWNSFFYSGFSSSGERVLTALILERHFPGAGKLWYCPAGAVCDYSDKELFAEFSAFMKKELKAHHAMALLADPCIELRINGEQQAFGKAVHDMFIANGYELNADAAKCLYKAPVQLMLDVKDKTPESLLKGFEKGIRYSVRVGEQRGLTESIYTIEDVKKDPQIMKDFASVMADTSERNDFLERDSAYCEHLMSVFGAEGLDVMLIYYDKSIDNALQAKRLQRKAELEKALPDAPQKKIRGITEEIESIDKQTEHYNERVNETKDTESDRIAVAGGMTLHYNGMSSCLFGGARNLLRNNLRASHYFNFRRICHTIAKGNTVHDLGYVLLENAPKEPDGTLGKFKVREDFEGILSFKQSFGSDLMEYVGEYALVANKAQYYCYTHLLEKGKKAMGTVNRILRHR